MAQAFGLTVSRSRPQRTNHWCGVSHPACGVPALRRADWHTSHCWLPNHHTRTMPHGDVVLCPSMSLRANHPVTFKIQETETFNYRFGPCDAGLIWAKQRSEVKFIAAVDA